MNASLWRAAAEPQDYEEEPLHPNFRMRCSRGHFLKVPVQSRGWKMYFIEGAGFESAESGPHYRLATDSEQWDEFEIYCPTCDAWGQFWEPK